MNKTKKFGGKGKETGGKESVEEVGLRGERIRKRWTSVNFKRCGRGGEDSGRMGSEGRRMEASREPGSWRK